MLKGHVRDWTEDRIARNIRIGGSSLKSLSATTRKCADDERKRRDAATSESPSVLSGRSVVSSWFMYGRECSC